MMLPPSISILVSSRDRRKEVEALISILCKLDASYSFEIVVVEETDDPVPIEGVRYISHPVANRGISYARNLALANASGDIVVFIDDDCSIHEGWLDNILEPFANNSIVGVQGGVTVPESTNSVGWAETILGFPGGGIRRVEQAKGVNQPTKELSTLNCAYRRWVIEKVGGFDERLKLGAEDYLLAKQACQHGDCHFVPSAMVSHAARGNLFKIWHWFVRRGRAEIGLVRIGKQKDTNFSTVIKSSIVLKLMLFMIVTALLKISADKSIIIFLSAYSVVQYVRFYKAYAASKSPFMTLLLIPVVKLTMDIAMDWGRLRGMVFD